MDEESKTSLDDLSTEEEPKKVEASTESEEPKKEETTENEVTNEAKKKSPIIPIIIVLLTLLLVGGIVYYFLCCNKITVTFKDGENVISLLKINKNEKLTIPDIDKEGFVLDGWYYNDEKVDANKTFDKDVTIVAKWNSVEKTMTITFDTNGGDPLEDQVIPCESDLNLPTPTKSGYKFLDWRDRHEMVISNETKLVCEDIHLKANWEKIEEKKEETKKEEPKKEYTCPTGYTLEGTKCVFKEPIKAKCDGQSVHDYNGQCVTVNNSARRVGAYSCPEIDIHVGSYAGKEKGELIQAGTYFCYYHKLSYNTQEQCESLSGQFGNFVWRANNSSCYVVRKNATMSCDSLSGYVYIGNPNETFADVNGLNGGCFPIVEKTKYCLDGWVANGEYCTKTIEATVK